MIVGVVVVGLLVLFLIRRGRLRRRRHFSGDVLMAALDMRRPYRGPRWRSPRRWL